MLLQLAIDDPAHLGVVPEVIDLVDIVEVGTPVLKRFGLASITTLRERSGGRPVLADTKTVDGGAKEAEMVFGAGASLMTVLSCASPATHAAAGRVAREYGAHVVVDTIADRRLPRRPGRFPGHCDYLALHSPTDRRLDGEDDTRHIDAVASMRALGYRVSLAGGIGPANLAAVAEAAPEIVVVGGAITRAENPRRTAEWIVSTLNGHTRGRPPSRNSPK
ncbi:3-hexulose-6-phosphate synthase [Actinomadura viridis]|uniref:3-hexulose-6-phosphate synthase n=1 Tax=Actinomadura viridis TaxID=58110 RepID=A0A931DEL6_9ACTN|nr:orotidine 5'-phosphate decarboxylase / HUMPS family protein [Actinomadura viridis]MBG6088675.1 3-hexulose-6-phosphate synthase [Actinomadura viridis]